MADVILAVPVFLTAIWSGINFVEWFRKKLNSNMVPFELKDREAIEEIRLTVKAILKLTMDKEQTLLIQSTIKEQLRDQLEGLVQMQEDTLK